MRTFFVGGNWKANGTRSSVRSLCAALNAGSALPSGVEVVCIPPIVHVEMTRQILRPDFAVGVQNIWLDKGGAVTGEVSAEMVKDCGYPWVLTGHSERRHLPQLKESDDLVAQKTRHALDVGLNVIVCVGETLEEREAGNTMAVNARQLEAVLRRLQYTDWDHVVIAYEPVWAIGTGRVASPEQAQEVHSAIRLWLRENLGNNLAQRVRIIYGGSVTARSAPELARQPDVDGFLVGGASLKPEFLEIISAANVGKTRAKL
eukprot:NODE_2290_length_1240_cov_20.352645_g2086_i0.p1 GENE.NODE_2290_length_1240_cov_20.352645_g2086_i0~~NODE_2290_length_1240_cov_20.352645_g2086_i0.p1  ORF type:complete len:260 (+),score=52.49 NODE_2290_length_1240_cov_20.352645_g2086_i0:116-895(+)